MPDGIYVALSGAIAQEAALESTAQNLANASTHGYQRTRAVFHEALQQQSAGSGEQRFAAVSSTALDTTPGGVSTTGRALDVALPSGTYLAVETPRGERYTRAGSLSIDANGALMACGAPVLGEQGKPITVDRAGPAPIIAADGAVRQGDGIVDHLRLVSFARASDLSHEGGLLLDATPASGAATAAKATIETGALEESNVSVVSSMTELVGAQRTFEAFQRAIDAFREADRKIVTTVPGMGG